MNATRDLIAAALHVAGIYEPKFEDEREAVDALRELCAQAMSDVPEADFGNVPVSAAEVPMPKPIGFIDRDDDNTWATLADNAYELSNLQIGSKVFTADQMRTYGDAREAAGYARGLAAVRDYAVMRWKAEVDLRPLENKHRRTMDDVWRQVISHTGGDPVALIGPCHDALVALRGEVK